MILFWLLTKHLIIDFPLQIPYMYRNKGTWGHPGGILHSLLHGIGTLAVINFVTSFSFELAFMIGLFDFLTHYLIDFGKMNVNRLFNLKPDNSEKFWWLLGLDQWLHQMTYLLIAGLLS